METGHREGEHYSYYALKTVKYKRHINIINVRATLVSMDLIEVNNTFTRRHPWELARLEILLTIIDEHVPRTGQKTVLDIGCGDCFFAQELLKKRPDVLVIGVDTAYSAKTAEDKINEINCERFKLFTSLNEAEEHIRPATIDLILLLDVIEHIKDDVAFLENIAPKEFAGCNTKFLITVPAFPNLYSSHDQHLKHFRRYSLKALKKTIACAALFPISSGYFFSTLIPLRLIGKLKEMAGYKQQLSGVGNWKHSSFITRLLKKILLFDYQISKRLQRIGIAFPGLSVYCICKKSE